MTKKEAKKLFGGTDAAVAKALGVSRSAISQWPDVLRQDQSDRVIGAAVRVGVLRLETEGEMAA